MHYRRSYPMFGRTISDCAAFTRVHFLPDTAYSARICTSRDHSRIVVMASVSLVKPEAPAAISGYVHCACRDCFDTAIGYAGEALCGLCAEAGCEPGNGDCERDDAYGG